MENHMRKLPISVAIFKFANCWHDQRVVIPLGFFHYKPLLTTIFNHYLVGGWTLPLWKIWVRQLEWWNSQWENNPVMFQENHQPAMSNCSIVLYTFPRGSANQPDQPLNSSALRSQRRRAASVVSCRLPGADGIFTKDGKETVIFTHLPSFSWLKFHLN